MHYKELLATKSLHIYKIDNLLLTKITQKYKLN